MKQKKQISEKLKIKPLPLTIAIILVILCFYTAYLVSYRNTVLPRTLIGSESFGGLSYAQSKEKLLQLIGKLPETYKLTIDGKEYSFLIKDVNFTPDISQIVDDLYDNGRSGSVGDNLFSQLVSPVVRNREKLAYSVDNAKLQDELNKIIGSIDNIAVTPKIEIKDNAFVLQKGQAGKMVENTELEKTILSHWSDGDFNSINISSSDKSFDQVNDQYQAVTDELNSYNQTLQLVAENKSKNVTVQMLQNWLMIVRDDQDSAKLNVVINQAGVSNRLQEIAEEIKVDPQNAKLVFSNGVVGISKDAIDGKKIDSTKARSLVVDAILAKQKTVALPVVMIPAEITRGNFSQLGIKEIIGTANTNFRGSTANRRHNISNGASILNGTVVRPGDEFSTAQVMGDVSDVTGFVPELVIKGDRSIPEFGGGLCQVATTLFRSVLNAGLRVTERQNHSIHVRYYEPPLGLDATVYFPHPDFRFVNDTDNYVLIQSRVSGNIITFDLFGTKDGRVAVITDPELLSTTPAPETKYIDTDTLFKGETKQQESAHEGATTIAYYTVTRDGKEITKKTFKSVYKAMPAQILVGTKDPPVAPVTDPAVSPAPSPSTEPSPSPSPSV